MCLTVSLSVHHHQHHFTKLQSDKSVQATSLVLPAREKPEVHDKITSKTMAHNNYISAWDSVHFPSGACLQYFYIFLSYFNVTYICSENLELKEFHKSVIRNSPTNLMPE